LLCGLKTPIADRQKGFKLEFELLKSNRFPKKWLTEAIIFFNGVEIQTEVHKSRAKFKCQKQNADEDRTMIYPFYFYFGFNLGSFIFLSF